ncbi:hypothetical protein [Clostridium botulinum]|uniref:Peptidase S1 domain-containing protein n=1 Tax=Clostridium botulinum TaxID=1491 RepID=A0A9Q1UWJ1_CLOBO|nr:hypothetical protein [Clostridium botulinum]AEB77529.1 hypothetical protein CbC4_6004 [Clostridium botulinum BKT015925]KEH95929.1 hypothetical protein Y848_p0105 [Clostridium botulinum C/D str. Sp77]KLU74526.1 hypothetical protein CBC3_13370 [Clostridium botulinum V891]KOA73668.1 hypothetical protein ADU78_11860 [Clostridium botulinum]KOA75388.1 hypothetical protein ADU77_11120 [Clostridium botulinum]
MYNCCNLSERILCIAKYEYSFFLNKNNVLGLGLGQKIKNGFNTFQPCITVFVRRKLPSNEIPINDLVPTLYKYIPTDVIETGDITPSSLTARIRPVPCGYSIGLPKGSGGTLGCLVTDARFNYILSCNHVLAQNSSEFIGNPIVQPSKKFGGKAPNDTIANLSIFIKLKTNSDNRADCAIAKISSSSNVTKNIALLGSPIKGISSGKIGMNVQKVGYYTEKTTGRITVLGATFNMPMWGKSYRFVDQIWTTKMDDKGDSGSILLDMHMNAVGLLMGGGSQSTVYNPIKKVLSSLNVEIITG